MVFSESDCTRTIARNAFKRPVRTSHAKFGDCREIGVPIPSSVLALANQFDVAICFSADRALLPYALHNWLEDMPLVKGHRSLASNQPRR